MTDTDTKHATIEDRHLQRVAGFNSYLWTDDPLDIAQAFADAEAEGFARGQEEERARILVGDEAGIHIADMLETLCNARPNEIVSVDDLREIARNIRKACGGWTAKDIKEVEARGQLAGLEMACGLLCDYCRQGLKPVDLKLSHTTNEYWAHKGIPPEPDRPCAAARIRVEMLELQDAPATASVRTADLEAEHTVSVGGWVVDIEQEAGEKPK